MRNLKFSRVLAFYVVKSRNAEICMKWQGGIGMRELQFKEQVNGFQLCLLSTNSGMHTYIAIIALDKTGRNFEQNTKYITCLHHPEVMLNRAMRKFNRSNPYAIVFDWKKQAEIILD